MINKHLNDKHAETAVLIILKTELVKKGMNYYDLQKKLEEYGHIESYANIRSKMARGTFGTIFFLRCLAAIGVKNIAVTDDMIKDLFFFNDSESQQTTSTNTNGPPLVTH